MGEGRLPTCFGPPNLHKEQAEKIGRRQRVQAAGKERLQNPLPYHHPKAALFCSQPTGRGNGAALDHWGGVFLPYLLPQDFIVHLQLVEPLQLLGQAEIALPQLLNVVAGFGKDPTFALQGEERLNVQSRLTQSPASSPPCLGQSVAAAS